MCIRDRIYADYIEQLHTRYPKLNEDDVLLPVSYTHLLVKRGITELVTPGVAINDNVLSYKENNFLAAVHFGKASCGVAFLEMCIRDRVWTVWGRQIFCCKKRCLSDKFY